MPTEETPWSLRVRRDDVPDQGAQFRLEADADTRKAIGRLAGLVDLPRLEARLDVRRSGPDGLHVSGTVSATVVQTCVITLEPLVNEISETLDLAFAPPSDDGPADAESEEDLDLEATDPPEPLLDGTVDLGALTVEALLLGFDPYPRKPGAVFEPPAAEGQAPGPFAKLAALKTKIRKGE